MATEVRDSSVLLPNMLEELDSRRTGIGLLVQVGVSAGANTPQPLGHMTVRTEREGAEVDMRLER